MFTSFFTWLKSAFSLKPVLIGKIGSCKCPNACAGSVACSTSCSGTCAGSCSSDKSCSADFHQAMAAETAPDVAEVVPAKKARKPRTPKAQSDK